MPIYNINQIADPIISIVIPVYMEEKILESILIRYTPELRSQYRAEIIVSDGGSTDNTVEIAKKYADIVAVHSEKRRQTIAEGRNVGGFLAKGAVIVFINGDTYPENMEKFLEFIYNWATKSNNKYSKYYAIATRVYVPKEDEKTSDKIFYNCFNTYVRFLNIIGVGMCRGECQIVSKDIFSKVKGYNSLLVAGEDFDLFNRIAKQAKTVYTSQITVLESPRRFRSQGYIRVLWHWTKNALQVIFKGKAADSEWTAIR